MRQAPGLAFRPGGLLSHDHAARAQPGTTGGQLSHSWFTLDHSIQGWVGPNCWRYCHKRKRKTQPTPSLNTPHLS